MSHPASGARTTRLLTTVLDAAPHEFVDVQRVDLTGESVTSALAEMERRMKALPVAGRVGRRSGIDRALLHVERADPLARSGRELVELVGVRRESVVVVLESVRQVRAPGIGVVHVGRLAEDAAVELFRRAATVATAQLDADPDSEATIRRICAVVDGNPSAIELAAARLPFMSLAALANALESPDQALDVLSRPASADGVGRAVRAHLVESHEAATPAAQQLLDLLSVFDGYFRLGAVAAVSEGVLASCYDALGELLDLRLVQLDTTSGDSRYRLSLLVRSFARKRLATAGLEPTVQARRADHYGMLAHRAARAYDDVDEGEARRVIGDDYAEALATARRLRDTDEAGALRLGADLGWVAYWRGSGLGLSELLDDLTRTEYPDTDGARRDALLWLAQTGGWSPLGGDRSEHIRRQLEEGVGLARRLADDDPLALLRALRIRYTVVVALGDVETGLASCLEGMQVASAIGHARWSARFEISAAATYGVLRQYDEAHRLARSGLARATRCRDQQGIALGSLLLHALPVDDPDDRVGLPSLEAVLDIFRAQGDVGYQMHTLATLAGQAVDADDPVAAARWTLQRMEHLAEDDLLHGLAVCVMLGVRIAWLRGDRRKSVLLHGSVASLVAPLLAMMAPVDAQRYTAGLDAVRTALGDEEFDAQVGRGRLLDREQTLVELADYLREVSATSPETASASRDDPEHELTPREQQVLELLAKGLRNKEIAAQLRITPKSVMHHTVAIYRKLDVHSRTEAVTAAARAGLLSIS